MVFVVKGEQVSCRSVVVKTIEGDQVEVESGLMKDDLVVLAPPAGLKDQDHIVITSRAAPTSNRFLVRKIIMPTSFL